MRENPCNWYTPKRQNRYYDDNSENPPSGRRSSAAVTIEDLDELSLVEGSNQSGGSRRREAKTPPREAMEQKVPQLPH